MFTGLVEAVGTVLARESRGDVVRLTLSSPFSDGGIARGDSIAVDGVCLTVVDRAADRWSADVIPETLARTTLGAYEPGRRVNLERSLRVGDRLGGHWVAGHVDGTGVLTRVISSGGEHRLAVEVEPVLRRYLAEKGSVAVDGVSLTVAAATAAGFEVALIPETLARTTLGERARGDRLNVEVDLLARYLESLLRADDSARERPGGRAWTKGRAPKPPRSAPSNRRSRS